jgi:hypothetical protein
MTAALKRTPFDDSVEVELSRWPGVTFHREQRGKHYALVLSYRGASRFVIYASTPGDTRRGALNHLTNVRAELRAMGATRLAPTKAEGRPKRQTSRTTATVYEFDRANPDEGPLRDPFAVLASFKPANDVAPAEPVQAPAPRQSLWSRIVAFVRRVLG